MTMATIDDLAKLKALRRSGMLEIQFGDRRVRYKSDAELVAAIAELEQELAGEAAPPRNVVLRTIKGW
jgi:hypothetical protein